MIVPDDVRKCVVFVGFRMADGDMRFAGSAFFVGREVAGTTKHQGFLVTARHVIDGIRSLGLNEVFIRVNTKAGNSHWLKCASEDWRFHPSDPSVDVAVLPAVPSPNLDHLMLPLTMCVTPEALAQNGVGPGDEVFIVGLFRHHHGTTRNIPIVRVGNLAAMTEEKVATSRLGLIDAYLVEARSIGGLSGSPAFLNLGVVRYLENQVKHAQRGPIFFLLGIVHGHYDVQASEIDTGQLGSGEVLSAEKVNTGIAIVVPIHRVLEVLDAQPRLDA